MFRELSSQFFLVSVILTLSDQMQGSKASLVGYHHLSYAYSASPFLPSLQQVGGKEQTKEKVWVVYCSALEFFPLWCQCRAVSCLWGL